ncbi:hypothetical protein CIK05_14615 [Bdellovibrio sp. qaytius]|nr:hypothetical protein CIK05_14615 [Bdellovibrio sp. qaytius]
MKFALFLVLAMTSFSSASFANYATYDSTLSETWPLDTDSMKQYCSSHNPDTWMAIAQQMISVKPIQNKIPDLNADEKMVLRNLLISAAYNRLFTHSLKLQNTKTPTVKYIWIAAGSQASVTVGHALQAGLADQYPEGSRQREIFTRLELLHQDVPIVPYLLLANIDRIKAQTAEGNFRVYSDIYWQHLAYTACGYDEIVLLNKILQDANPSMTDHYERFLVVWNDMETGHYLEANMQLIYIEQHNILQPQLYDGLDAQTASALGLFNGLAKAGLKGPGGRSIDSFNAYSIKHFQYPNLAYFPTRFEWQKYVVTEQALYLQELGTIPAIQSVLQPSLEESYQVVNDYFLLAK